MAAYYNEIEPYAAQWLRNLIKAGHIADGEVDTRSIVDISPDDLRGFTQCHFFAGIGGWSHALRLAGWPDSRPVWTGSCPCQPFSVAGKGAGADDPRHLWPHFHRLIAAVRPPVVMGEQVAAAVGKSWLDGVSSDLEGIGYACGAVVVPACAVDAPHRRDRLWFVADASCERRQQIAGSTYGDESPNERRSTKYNHISPSYGEGNVADAAIRANIGSQSRASVGSMASGDGAGDASFVAGASFIKRNGRECGDDLGERRGVQEQTGASDSHMADAGQVGRDGWASPAGCEAGADAGVEGRSGADVGHPDMPQCDGGRISGGVHAEDPDAECGGRRGHWDTYEWAIGADGKSRRSKPGLPLLANGVPARVGKLRAYGNAICAPLAAEVISAFMESV